MVAILALLIAADSVPSIHANRTTQALRIDGILEPAWQTGDSAKGFIQRYPNDGKPAAESTTVYVLCDEENLYVALKCYARPDELDLEVTPRDQRSGDNVGLLLDSFDDKTNGYYFCVNAKGVEYDTRITSDGMSLDNSWDGIWFSAARVTDWGYCVELKIPFKSIRYKPGLTEWGINFDRYAPRRNEQDDWSPAKNRMFRVSTAGRLVGIEPHSRGLNLEVYPVGLARYDEPAQPNLGADAGLDVAWYPGSTSSIQLTVNPDFAEIEADPTVVNLGRYEDYLSERRPFFIGSSDVFQLGPSGTDIFYSRRIGRPLANGGSAPILAGLKAVTRFGRFEAGGMGVACRETTFGGFDSLGVPLDTDRLSYYSAFRLRRSVLRNSSVGFLYAGKENRLMGNEAGGFNGEWHQGGFDVSGDVAYALYRQDTVRHGSLAGELAGYWQGKVFSIWLNYYNIPHEFDVRGIGFEPAKDEFAMVSVGALFRNLGIIRGFQPRLYAKRTRDNDDLVHHYYTDAGTALLNFDFTNNWGGYLDGTISSANNYVYDPPLLDSTFHYTNASYGGSLWSDPSFPVNFYLYGSGTARSYNYRRHYFAPNAYTDLTLNWRITPSLSVGADVQNTIELDTLSRVEQMNWIVTPSVSYAITKDLQLRLSGEVVPADSAMRASFLLSWNLAPKSWLYLAWNERHQVFADGDYLMFRTAPIVRTGVVKLRYLFYF